MEKRRYSKEEVRQWRREHRGLVYFNKEDSNLFINRTFGISWSLNWANPQCYVVIAALVIIVIAVKVLSL